MMLVQDGSFASNLQQTKSKDNFIKYNIM